jgi:hypothetical protein
MRDGVRGAHERAARGGDEVDDVHIGRERLDRYIEIEHEAHCARRSGGDVEAVVRVAILIEALQ